MCTIISRAATVKGRPPKQPPPISLRLLFLLAVAADSAVETGIILYRNTARFGAMSRLHAVHERGARGSAVSGRLPEGPFYDFFCKPKKHF